MSNHNLAPLIAPFISLVPILIAGASTNARRRIIDRLSQAGATGPQRAIALDPRSRLERRWIERLSGSGVIWHSGTLYYLDEAADIAACRLRRARIPILIAVALAALGLGAALVLIARHH